jgi:polyisoprenoid-binding protein YceI
MARPVRGRRAAGMRRLRLVLALGGLVASARADVVAIDPAASRIDFAVSATIGSFTGHLENFDLRVDLAGDNRTIAGAVLRFPVAALRTGNRWRNGDMLRWLEAGRFPEARFVLDRLAGATAFGRLTLHGATRPVSFPVAIAWSGARVVVAGQATIDVRRWGLPPIRTLAFLRVDPRVRVSFRLAGAVRAAPR